MKISFHKAKPEAMCKLQEAKLLMRLMTSLPEMNSWLMVNGDIRLAGGTIGSLSVAVYA